MNENLYFTKAQLDKLNRKELVTIAKYYKLRIITKGLSKEQLKDLIWNSFNALENIEADNMSAPMSVRIRRIKESNR
jgi:hypothetical protein